MGVITNLAVSISILSAFPWVRNTHHKYVPISAASLAAFSHPPNPLQRFRAAPSVHRLVSTVFPIGQASAPCVLTLASRRLGLLSSRYPFRAAPYPDGWCARTLRPGTFSQRARIHPNPHRICCACVGGCDADGRVLAFRSVGVCRARRQLRPRHALLEPGRHPCHPPAGLLVYVRHDGLVRVSTALAHMLGGALTPRPTRHTASSFRGSRCGKSRSTLKW